MVWVGRLQAQEFIPLYPKGKKPNSNGRPVKDSLFNERIWQVAEPGIYAFRVPPADNRGASVLICPGGGYERLSHIYNGFNFASWFNARGINVFVLIYRLPHQPDLERPQLAPLQDAQRAMKLLRARSAQWKLDPARIGVMGISAGGHVAGMLGTVTQNLALAGDSLDTTAFRPDFMVLLSPVVTMGAYAHKGSKRIFLGKDTTQQAIRAYSNEWQVSSFTPPSFLVHAQNDSSVSVHNSLLLYSAMVGKKVDATLHVFPQGGHGIKLVDNPGSTELWLPLLAAWLDEKNITRPSTRK